ncbi:F-box/LRR-repeat protein 20 [Hyalella azteca]|uniref:F-box/LRR-repeat protein 20 n=1 Tax=Hyalella azteca TaxID=294128 RepID=A0A8B7NZM9_HYAAZ|nr:F-box/LRR-repeat protein 20 [Hyalella azteca]
MPQLHQPGTLFSTSLYAIAHHFEYLCYGIRDRKQMAQILEDDTYRTYPGPFTRCPSRVLEGALHALHTSPRVRHVQTRHLHMLLQPQLLQLHLTFGSGDVHVALQLLHERCTALRVLNISYLRNIEPNILLSLTPNLTHLTHLNLAHTEADDTVLSGVGRHCPLLRDINVSCCPVSENALRRLFWDSHHKVKTCGRVTRVNLTGCEVSPGGVRAGLLLQPALQHVEHENNLLAFDVNHGYDWADELSYAITSLTATGVLVTDVAMDTIVAVCPCLTSLTLSSCVVSQSTLLTISSLSQLTQLSITNTADESVGFCESIVPLLCVRGSQLTSLLLATFTYVDLNVIGAACPNIENLALSNVAVFEPVALATASASGGKPFERLQALEIWTELRNSSCSAAVLRLLLLHCTALRNLLLRGADQLSHDQLMTIWLTSNPMQELTRLTLDTCPNVTSSTLEFLLTQENKLNMLRVWNCFNIHKSHEINILSMIKTGNMDVYFEWYAWEG